jgi:flagellar basal body L-ring protein FlgH
MLPETPIEGTGIERQIVAHQEAPMFTRNIFRILAAVLVILSSGSALSQVAPMRTGDHNLRLTPATPSAERTATIVAPGSGAQSYNVFYLDTRAFAQGGVLDIDIQIAPNSATDGSFDLFPAGVPIPTRGRPDGTLTGRYDIRRGTSTRLEYRFELGQVFVFGLEGNWGAPRGATGLVQFRATVAGNTIQADPSVNSERNISLTTASPSADRSATIVAPGNGQHYYNTFFIDTRGFARGGVLDIEIQIAPNSGTDGSFDLFPGNIAPLGPGRPGGNSFTGRYDVRRGSSTRIEYRFQPGQTFVFGLEGNWFSSRGATGVVRFRASVHP